MDGKIAAVLRFLGSVFISFGIVVLILSCIGRMAELISPESAEELVRMSTMFIEGGISYATLFQYFVCCCLVATIRYMVMSEWMAKRLPFLVRCIVLFVGVVGVAVTFVVLFGWFPIDSGEGWAGFALSFTLCSGTAIMLSVILTRAEQKKYDRLLREYKDKAQRKGKKDGGY